MFTFKLLVLGFPLAPDLQVDTWDVEVRVSFEADGGPAKVSLLVPQDTPRFALVDEHFISRGYGVSVTRVGVNRKVTWAIRQAKGRQVLYYRGTVQRIETSDGSSDRPAPHMRLPDLTGPERIAVDELVSQIRARSADVDSMASELFSLLNAPDAGPNVRLLLGKKPSQTDRMRTAVVVLMHAGVPARVVNGVRLQALERNAPVVRWVQAYDAGVWHSFDPKTGAPQVPDEYMAWWRGLTPLVRGEGADRLHTQLSIALNKEKALIGATERGRRLAPALLEVSLLSLPLDTQGVYHVLLMVPIGVLILVVMRNVVGIKTFGTFMPVLIALAFRETRLLWGVALFCLIVALGLAVRFYFDRLKLLLVPRLASVLIVVVLLMAALSIVSNRMGIYQGLSVALFPMVILTMTIERMSIVWEERGPAEALQQGFGSLLVAAIAYLIMNIALLQHVIFIYPELHLVVLAVAILLGRYSGYRLTELRRFRELARSRRQ